MATPKKPDIPGWGIEHHEKRQSLSDQPGYVQHKPQPDYKKLIEDMRRAGIPGDEIQKLIKDDMAMRANPVMAVNPGQWIDAVNPGQWIDCNVQKGGRYPIHRHIPDPYSGPTPLKPRQWTNEPPMTYDTMTQNLTPVGAIFLRLNAGGSAQAGSGMPLPHIAHISAHIVQKPSNGQSPEQPTKAFVFIVDDEGTDITLEDEYPHLFPSDNLILRIKMITDK